MSRELRRLKGGREAPRPIKFVRFTIASWCARCAVQCTIDDGPTLPASANPRDSAVRMFVSGPYQQTRDWKTMLV